MSATAGQVEVRDRASAVHEPIDPDEYRALFRHHPAGVAVITLSHGGRLIGFTATSVISVSATPPLLAFSLQGSSSSWPAVRDAETLAVSFLAAGQGEVSARFATSGIDRFAAGGWRLLSTGEPVIDDAVQWVRGRIVQRTDTGGSYLVTVHALESSAYEADESHTPPLVYHDRAYHGIGEQSGVG